MKIIKPVKATHLLGSKASKKDPKFDVFETSNFLSERLIYQEKIDGFPIAVSFDKDGGLIIKHLGKTPPSVIGTAVKKWANAKEAMLLNYLGDDFVLHGEWMKERQTVFYDNLPSPFVAVDIFDKENEVYLCMERLDQFCSLAQVVPAPTIIAGVFNIEDVARWASRPSKFGQEQVEGVYVRMDDEFRTISRAQYVGERGDSSHKNKTNTIRSEDA